MSGFLCAIAMRTLHHAWAPASASQSHPRPMHHLEPTKGAHEMPTSNGPTLHVALQDAAVDAAIERATRQIDVIFNDAADEAKRYLTHAVSHAYREGLRDGFVQGVTANSETTR